MGFNLGLSWSEVVGTSVGIDELGFSVGASVGFRLYAHH